MTSFLCGQFQGFNNYAPFSKFLHIHKEKVGLKLLTQFSSHLKK